MFKYYILNLAVVCTLFTSCRDKDEVPVPDTDLPDKTSVLIVHAISDHSSPIAFSLDANMLATVSSDNHSAYIPVSEGKHTLKFTAGGAAKELAVSITKDKYYTVVVYGTSANPSVSVIEDAIATAAPAGQFAYRYLNVYDSSVVKSISSQAYYPSYGLWATVTGTQDHIAFGAASAFSNYTAGIEAQWRIIEAGTETSAPLAGYKAGSTHVVYAPTDRALGTEGNHFTYLIFGHGTTGSYKLVVHEDQVAH